MDKLISNRNYVILLLLHIGIGIFLFYFTFLSIIFGTLILIFSFLYVLINKDKNQEVLKVSAYITGVEIFLRMTEGNLIYEFSKYSIILLMIIGIILNGSSKKAMSFLIFFILLLPSIITSLLSENYSEAIQKSISFNLSGPFCLIICSIYTIEKKISFQGLINLLIICLFPIISTLSYLFFYNPNVKEVVTGTASNFTTSGGFGPNQVSTILGLGMFIIFSLILFYSKNKFIIFINIILLSLLTYRGLVTFSRGGVLTALIISLVLILITYYAGNFRVKSSLQSIFIFLLIFLSLTWIYTLDETKGLIENRYSGKDALGREKRSSLTGRADVANSEIEMFLKNPILGVGVSQGDSYRLEHLGYSVVSHNEITRMLAEHGILGVIGLFILIGMPLVYFVDNKYNLFFLSFLLFWLFTINHSSMRVAAPSLIYSLSLLKVYLDE